MYQIGYIFVGWLLGLLSPQIIEFISRPHRRKALARSLSAELDELRIKLSYNAFLVASRQGKITHSLLKRIQPIVGHYKGFYADPEIVEFINSLAKKSDADLKQLPADPPGRSIQFKKYTLPFLRSQVASLALFSLDLQRQLFEIGAKMDSMNEDIDTLWFYHSKTFDTSLSPENSDIVRTAVEESIAIIGSRSLVLAEDITRLFSSLRQP